MSDGQRQFRAYVGPSPKYEEVFSFEVHRSRVKEIVDTLGFEISVSTTTSTDLVSGEVTHSQSVEFEAGKSVVGSVDLESQEVSGGLGKGPFEVVISSQGDIVVGAGVDVMKGENVAVSGTLNLPAAARNVYVFGEYSKRALNGLDNVMEDYILSGKNPIPLRCFISGTPIRLSDGTDLPIEDITAGMQVASFSETDLSGRGALDAKPVVRLYTNVTQELIRLEFDDGRDVLHVTPGHAFLDEVGSFSKIGDLARLGSGHVRIIDETGRVVTARATTLRFSEGTADMFERASVRSMSVGGAVAFKEEAQEGWKTYNFEVADHHTYVAGGIRVHNDSGVLGQIGNNIDAILNKLGIFGDVAGDIINGVFHAGGQVLGGLTGAITAFGGGLSDASDAFRKGDFSGGIKAIGKGIGDAIDKVARSVRDGLNEVAKGIGNAFRSAFGENDESDGRGRDKMKPIILDMDGDGVEISVDGNVNFDMDGDGYKEDTAWVNPDDAFLVLDLNADGSRGSGDGKINQTKELILTEWLDSDLATDLQALASFDTSLKRGGNNDGVLDHRDSVWSELKVWQDRNSNGVVDSGELKTLSQLGFSKINLTYDDGTHYSDLSNDVSIFNSTLLGSASYVRNGKTVKGGVGDVALSYGAIGHNVLDSYDSVDFKFERPRDSKHAKLSGRSSADFDISSKYKDGAIGDGRDNEIDARGHSASVHISGGRGKDYLKGGLVGDVLLGNSGSDSIKGYDGNDFIAGGAGADTIYGGSGNDIIWGGSSQDYIDGDDGDDVIYIDPGEHLYSNDTKMIQGGSGYDMVVLEEGASLKTSDLSWYSFEAFKGAGGNDRVEAYSRSDQWLHGGGGNDFLAGYKGNDTLIGGTGNDSLRASDGDDYLRDDEGKDRFDGGEGNDTASYYGWYVKNKILTVALSTGANNSGDTYISIENLQGSNRASDHLTGRDDENNVLRGESGNDSLYGLSGDDTLIGGSGNDYLRDASGSDHFIGGSGRDTVSYLGYRSKDLKINLKTGENNTYDTYESIENVYGSETRNDHITGSNGDNLLKGSGGNDSLYGEGGNDTLSGGDGNDYLRDDGGKDHFIGGSGNDTVSYYGWYLKDVVLEVNLADGTNNSADTYSSIENILGSDKASDHLRGNGAANRLRGVGGNDTIVGEAGNDKIEGGDGNDRLYGGTGNDTLLGGDGNDYLRDDEGADQFIGGAGSDTASYYGWYVKDRVLEVNLTDGTNNSNDTYNSIENVLGSDKASNRLIGGSGTNRLTGGSQNDKLFGVSGNDVLKGGDGNDSLYGGAGDDTLMGGSGNDYLRDSSGTDHFIGGSGRDTVSYLGYRSKDLKINLKTGENNTYDTYESIENVYGSETRNDHIVGSNGDNLLKGSGGNDSLWGASGNDTLSGGDGSDFLDGGNGAEVLYGGAGADTFHFDKYEDHDTIKDFENNVDVIQLDNFTFSGGKDAFDFARQVGDDVVFEFGGGDRLTVENVTIGQLQNDLELV